LHAALPISRRDMLPQQCELGAFCRHPPSAKEKSGADPASRCQERAAMAFQRLAIYYLPPPGPLADFGNTWLGWDARAGVAVARPDCGLDLAALTAAPHRYGFHATLKAPFRLAADRIQAEVVVALHDHAARLAPVLLPEGLALRAEHGFLALMPPAPVPELTALAAGLVRGLDGFRAPLTAAERARRRPETLSPRQRAQLDRWGYPWIFADFRFH